MTEDGRDALIAASSRALKEGRREEAVALARQVERAFPHHAGGLSALVDALTQSGVYEFHAGLRAQFVADGSLAEAVTVLQALIRIDSSDYLRFLQLGNCLTALGDYQGASQAVRQATDLYVPMIRPQAALDLTDNAPVLLPRFFVIGAQKCGTTSLYNYLVTHPLVLPPVVKECHYFLYPERTLEWYRSHFPKSPAGSDYVTGDFSASTLTASEAPALLRRICPDAKLIVMVRNPVDRAISHHRMNREYGIESRTLGEAIAEELDLLESGVRGSPGQTPYVFGSIYAGELGRWLDVFPREQLLILIMEEMQRDPASAVAQAFAHIGVPPHEVHEFNRLNEGVYGDAADAKVRGRLGEFFRDHNERFYELIGRRLDWNDAPAGARFRAPPAANKARSLAAQERWADAAAAWQACLTDAPEHPDASWWRQSRSEALLKAGEIDAAEASFRELVNANAMSVSGLEGLARVVLARNDPRQSLARLEDCVHAFPLHRERRWWLIDGANAGLACGELDRAEAMFRILASDYPGEAAGPAGLARIAKERHDHARAIMLWEECLARFPGHADSCWWLLDHAYLLIDAGQLDRAEAAARQLIAACPAFANGPSCLADVAFRLPDPARAVGIWQECIGRFPDHPDRRLWLVSAGNALLQLKRWGEAGAICGMLRTQFPEEAAGFAGGARAAREVGETEAATLLWEECLQRFPDHSDRQWWLLALARILLAQGELDRAEVAARQLIAADPAFPGGPASLADIAFSTSDRARAVDILQECIARFPDHPNQLAWLSSAGESLFQLRRWTEAVAAFGLLRKEFPEDPRGYAGGARVARECDEAGEAVRFLEYCLDRFPDHPDTQWWLLDKADLLLRQGQLDRAETVARQLIAAYPALANGPVILADVGFRTPDPAKALNIWLECIARFPDHPSRRALLTSAGNALLLQKRWSEAGGVFSASRKEFPDEPSGYSGGARAARELGEREASARLWEECLQRFPDHTDRQWWLLSCLHALIDLGEDARALPVSDEIILAVPEEAPALAVVARFEAHRGKLAAACGLWEECLRRSPSDPERRWWLLGAGQACISRGLPGTAEAHFRRLTEEFPGEAQGWAGLARALGLQSRAPEAVAIWNSCIARFPDNPERSWWLPVQGHLLLDLGRMDEAQDVFDRMNRDFPDDPAALGGLARIHYLKSDWRLASRLLEDMLRRFPGDASRETWAKMHAHASLELSAGR